MMSWKKENYKRQCREKKTFGREGGKSLRCQRVGWIILVEAGVTKNDKDVTMGENY